MEPVDMPRIRSCAKVDAARADAKATVPDSVGRREGGRSSMEHGSFRFSECCTEEREGGFHSALPMDVSILRVFFVRETKGWVSSLEL
mmetsp:Transcript_23921/g.70602  ORF Transcript_23921/g.70602 Transcript_23921/m.70602 type:complete len:88 (-) Transcript_23921:41-304(-)